MRLRTALAATVLAATALLGSAGTALADGGAFEACGQFSAVGEHSVVYGNGCAAAQWMGDAPMNHLTF
ncbi:hypothetical protein ABZ721_18485 [Streptomyces sp. NPDC006733]|uniref:hypothetical protein n=1 Tax=Streptomyces sp. NPDC006733 TaxID=3155460 RepID=UPI0033CFF688